MKRGQDVDRDVESSTKLPKTEKFLSNDTVLKLAFLGIRDWLSAAKKTLCSRKQLYGTLVELRNKETQGIQLHEVLERDDGTFRHLRELKELPTNYLMAELMIKPVISNDSIAIPPGVVLQFPSCKIHCHTHGIPKIPSFIGTNFTSLSIKFTGAIHADDTFYHLMQAPNLRNLEIKHSDIGPRGIVALSNFLRGSNWETVIMEYKRLPPFMADASLLRHICNKWTASKSPSYKTLKIYGRVVRQEYWRLHSMYDREHPQVPGLRMSLQAAHDPYYFPVTITFGQ
ncbi:hypothetical protein QR680_010536 [Steinernema hermaphroditum]|uniref:Uncharacterized protein n=1 Tax=Steinernema hermaphroditum TaxID=289476 RepID=A0AA39IPD5_9BILA|nr:hypothetical protein QR680_010536 [Steinernema hermaphroditum]